MDIRETSLPGIGVRYDLSTRAGGRLAVVVRRDGRYELGVYDDPRDEDLCRTVLALQDDEADALAGILGAPRILDALQELQALGGLQTEQLRLNAGSPYAGRTLGDTQARTRTGVSIVAIVREGTSIASPTPATDLVEDDVLVVVGTPDGVRDLRALLRDG
ncbi:MAG: TrkA domain protein [Frankiaceae bacterium]|jgi:TrkA domain protein|nr:TrkA domain protein [Frankiaceae bacterium]MDX6224141.1 TrkA domain protein [Frankiales bacterium]MDX6273348.1 TrkA domain protein [Frankiales bacterium]